MSDKDVISQTATSSVEYDESVRQVPTWGVVVFMQILAKAGVALVGAGSARPCRVQGHLQPTPPPPIHAHTYQL